VSARRGKGWVKVKISRTKHKFESSQNKEMEHKDYIEKIVLDNLDDLNRMEPPEGHFERFEERLKTESKLKTFRWNRVWKVAAVIAFLFLAGNQAMIWLAPDHSQPMTLAAVSPEYADVEFYYTSNIRTGLTTLNTLTGEGVISEEENLMIQQEFKNMELKYEELLKDLNAHPRDERVLNALIEYYQNKLSVIDMILSKLQEVKQQKNKSHETEV